MADYLSFEKGIKYPWEKPGRLFYALWILLPIIGWAALIGYWEKIIKNLVDGKIDGLPEWGGFGENMIGGFILFVKLIPLYLVLLLISFIPFIGEPFVILGSIFIVPFLVINMIYSGRFEDSFDVKKAWNLVVVKNLMDYVIVAIKSIGFAIIYMILSMLLIGIPGYMFGSYYYVCDFFRKVNGIGYSAAVIAPAAAVKSISNGNRIKAVPKPHTGKSNAPNTTSKRSAAMKPVAKKSAVKKPVTKESAVKKPALKSSGKK